MKRSAALALVLIFCLLLCSCTVVDKLTAPQTYEIRFEMNGGTLVSGSLLQTVADGEDAVPPRTERDGYDFDSWSGTYQNVHKNAVIVAQWIPLCTVTFDAGPGAELSGDAVQTVRRGELPEPPEVSLSGYSFDGWEPEVRAADGDVTYTAKWSEQVYTGQQIYTMISPGVVEITTYGSDGESIGLGSGFFLDDHGLIATNFHVIQGAFSADVTLSDGTVTRIDHVVDYNEDLDIALVRADTSSNDYLTVSDTPVSTGDVVYAMGSSMGLTGTFSDGIVSAAKREINGVDCIQVTAPISHGNSGGPLVNEHGKVVGINSMTMTDGQNLNFSINVHLLEQLSQDGRISMADFGSRTTYVPETPSVDLSQGFYSVVPDHEVEPNDGYLLADRLGNDVVIAGEVGDENDVDMFLVTAEQAQTLTFSVLPFNSEDQRTMLCAVAVIGDDGLEILKILEADAEKPDILRAVLDVEAGDYLLLITGDDDEAPPYPMYYAASCFWDEPE